MASHAQIEANRQNAKKSTGLITESGKSVAKLNAVKHGLSSKNVVIPGEDPEEFEELRRQVEEEFQPVGWREIELVERVAVHTWRLRRLYAVEAGVFAYQQARIELERAHGDVVKYGFSSFLDDELVDGDPEEFKKAKAEKMKAVRSLEIVSKSIGAAFIEDARCDNAIGKLSRYEASLGRSLRQANAELERLQADRRTKNGPTTNPPVTIDMTVGKDVEPP